MVGTPRFDYSSLTYEDRENIHNLLAETTVKHIDANSRVFSAMLFDVAASPSQKLEVVHLPPAPAQLDEIHFLAETANKDLSQAIRDELGRQPNYMKAARYILNEDGTNIVHATTHSSIIDVAIWQAAWVEAIDMDNWQETNGLGISRGVTTIQAFGAIAASEVTQKMGHVFMSFPRTKTIEDLAIEPGLVDANNRAMRSEVKKWMGTDIPHIGRRHSGNSLHVAIEGKTTKIVLGDDHKPESIQLGRISDGTIDLVRYHSGRTILQPIAIWEGGDEPKVEIGELRKIHDRKDVDKVQNWHRETLAKMAGISVDNITVAS